MVIPRIQTKISTHASKVNKEKKKKKGKENKENKQYVRGGIWHFYNQSFSPYSIKRNMRQIKEAV